MFPLIPIAIGATIAGIGFAVGKKIANSVIIPMSADSVEHLKQSWANSSEKYRQQQLDEIDPAPLDEKPKKPH